MMVEVSQQFYFDAAHTLRRDIEVEGSRRIHGHTYQAEVTIRGRVNEQTGMVVDLGDVRREVERVRETLDHRFLDDVPNLGTPTLENLCAYIRNSLQPVFPDLSEVRVWRAAIGDACKLTVDPVVPGVQA
ncbi:MAG: hypothetical protein RIS34_1379 [Pseudomonadota bacterium]|jgi:6-pyruvoyltetrahydropterin/6-carboxytetrahydropterin synthase